jgi:hypothetical protein
MLYKHRRILGSLIILFLLVCAPPVLSQRITDTPVPVNLPDIQSVQPTNVLLSTPTTTPTATPELPSVLLQAIDTPQNINVRDYPDVIGAYLGSLEPEEQYEVTGRFFSWYQFRYETAPDGLGWVFGQSVRIIGDDSDIPIIDPDAAPTPVEDPTLEAQLRLLTPDVANTATASARILSVPTDEFFGNGQQFPPTYTPPPDVVALAPTQSIGLQASPTPPSSLIDATIESVASGDIPPILPILGLGVFGLLGLLISLIRA